MSATPASQRGTAPQTGTACAIVLSLAFVCTLGVPPSQVVAAEDFPPLLVADFARPGHGWQANGAIGDLRQEPRGLSLRHEHQRIDGMVG